MERPIVKWVYRVIGSKDKFFSEPLNSPPVSIHEAEIHDMKFFVLGRGEMIKDYGYELVPLTKKEIFELKLKCE